MKISLRFKCLIVWHRLTKKINKTPLIKISNQGSGVANILFLLPSDNINAQITSYFVNQDLVRKRKTISYFVHEKGLKYYPEKLSSSFITYNDNDLNWWGVIVSQFILNRINSIHYDAIIDLNQKPNQAEKFLIMSMSTKLKIGFYSKISEDIYNIIIKKDSSTFLEKQYSLIERILGLV